MNVLGCWESGAPREDVEASRSFPVPGPVHLLHLAVPDLHPLYKLVT